MSFKKMVKEALEKTKEGDSASKIPEVTSDSAGKEEVVKKTTIKNLEELQKELGVAEFLSLAKIVEGVGVGKSFDGSVPKDLDFVKAKKSDFNSVLSELFNSKSTEIDKFSEKLAEKGVDLEGKDFIGFMADLFSGAMLKKAKKKFDEKYPNFNTFPKAKEAVIDFEVKILKMTDFEVNFNWEKKELEKECVKFEKDEKDKKDKALSAEDKAEAELDKKEKEDIRVAKIKKIEGSLLGKFLVSLGFVEKGKFGDVVDGNNWFAAVIVGFFGGDELVGNVYEEAIVDLDEDYKNKIKPFRKKALGSFLSLKGKKPEVPESGVEETLVGLVEFQDIVDRKKPVPSEGIKLKENYVLGKGARPEELTVSFKKGGKMTVFGSTTFMLNGSKIDVPIGEKKSYDGESAIAKNSQIEVGKKIPKDTVFTEGVEFLSA